MLELLFKFGRGGSIKSYLLFFLFLVENGMIRFYFFCEFMMWGYSKVFDDNYFCKCRYVVENYVSC